jgi:hypothetical protein
MSTTAIVKTSPLDQHLATLPKNELSEFRLLVKRASKRWEGVRERLKGFRQMQLGIADDVRQVGSDLISIGEKLAGKKITEDFLEQLSGSAYDQIHMSFWEASRCIAVARKFPDEITLITEVRECRNELEFLVGMSKKREEQKSHEIPDAMAKTQDAFTRVDFEALVSEVEHSGVYMPDGPDGFFREDLRPVLAAKCGPGIEAVLRLKRLLKL